MIIFSIIVKIFSINTYGSTDFPICWFPSLLPIRTHSVVPTKINKKRNRRNIKDLQILLVYKVGFSNYKNTAKNISLNLTNDTCSVVVLVCSYVNFQHILFQGPIYLWITHPLSRIYNDHDIYVINCFVCPLNLLIYIYIQRLP